MEWVVEMVARLVRATYRAWESRWIFLLVAFFSFGASVSCLAAFDVLPSGYLAAAEVAIPPQEVARDGALAILPEMPEHISIPTIGLKATIANPTSSNIAVLDAALLKGAVRYPTSAKLGESGNVVLFGHSSYLPVVHNQAYKTFDDIQKLKKGDTVLVSSSGRTYTYSVITVKKENTETGAIPLTVTGRILTLATCDSFGSKNDRFVVTAEFVESHSITAPRVAVE